MRLPAASDEADKIVELFADKFRRPTARRCVPRSGAKPCDLIRSVRPCQRGASGGEGKREKIHYRSFVRIHMLAGARRSCRLQVQAVCALPGGPGQRQDLRVPRRQLAALAFLPCGPVLPHVQRHLLEVAPRASLQCRCVTRRDARGCAPTALVPCSSRPILAQCLIHSTTDSSKNTCASANAAPPQEGRRCRAGDQRGKRRKRVAAATASQIAQKTMAAGQAMPSRTPI